MGALELLTAFSPWLAFWVISAGGSMAWLRIGICVAALLVIVMGITKLHRGLILWAGIIFFAFALVAAALLENSWVIRRLGIPASGTPVAATMVSIVIGEPFTEGYARDHVPRELWDSPAFIRSCYTATGVWGMIFLTNVFVNAAKPYYSDMDEWLFRGVELCVLTLGVVFTTVYSGFARRRREAAVKNDG